MKKFLGCVLAIAAPMAFMVSTAEVVTDEPSTATWTGNAGNGDPTDAGNWDCRNSVGVEIPGGLPTAATDIVISGNELNFNCPAGTVFPHGTLAIGDCTLAVDSDWRGLGTFSVNGVVDLQGHVLRTASNPEGSGEITSLVELGAVEAPGFVASDAKLWLDASDASTLTIDADGNVVSWRSKDASAATATASAIAPKWNPRDWGRPCVDFGVTGSGCDMTYPRITTLRTIFFAIKIEPKTEAFLLGDINNGKGNYQFHRLHGAYGNYKYAKYDQVWNGLRQVDWINDDIPANDFQIISITTTQNCTSDSLTQDRNIADRNGGRQLFELICFERVLDDAERTQVVQYLQQKWMEVGQAGNFRLTVPEDASYENLELKLSGNLAFTKEGEGTFTAARNGQTYFRGNAVLGGTASLPLSGSDATTWAFSAGAYGYSEDGSADFRVGSGATLETMGNYGGHVFNLVLDGGTLSNRGCAMNAENGGFGPMVLTADSTIAFEGQTAFLDGGNAYAVDLKGHVLTIEMNGQKFLPGNGQFTNGVVRLLGNGQLVATSALDWRTVDLHTDGSFDMGATLDVHDYSSVATSGNHSGSSALSVWGTFTPFTDNFYGCTLQDGATLCLTNRTEEFTTTATSSAEKPTVDFAPDATIVLDIRGRNLVLGDRIVAWELAPNNVAFQWDAASGETASQQPMAKIDGVYYGGEQDNTVFNAVWTGAANDGNVANPTNWTCRNVANEVVEGGVPGVMAAVHFTGDLAVNFPAGSACRYRDYEFNDVRLKADCDWRGLEATEWGTIDLDGHKLYVSKLPASGTICTAPAPAAVARANFWLDAASPATITRDSANKVTRWASRTGSVAASATADTAPTYDTENWAFPTLDFGAVGSNLDMRYSRFSNLRTVFWVVKIAQMTEAFLLGDVGAKNYNFHRGTNGAYASKNGKFSTVWNGTTAVAPLTDIIPDDDFQIISATMSANAYSNSLTNDRNIEGRSGGRQLSELICFSSVLSNEDRTAITQYLQHKWFDGAFRGELHLEVPAGETVVNSGLVIKDTVKFVKEGDGTFVGSLGGQTYTGGNDIQAGEVRPALVGTQHVFGLEGSEMVLRDGTVFEQNGLGNYESMKFVLDGGVIRNTGADLNDNSAALGNILLTADSVIQSTSTLTVSWNGHFLDLGGHALHVATSPEGKFAIGANSTVVRNGVLEFAGAGRFRVFHGALDASTISLRAGCAIEVRDDAGPITVKDYTALCTVDENIGTNIVKVLDTFKPAAGAYFRGCELQNGATLDISAQTGVFCVEGAFTSGANLMTFAEGATSFTLVLGNRPIPAGGKVVDWTGHAPAQLENMVFTLADENLRWGRRLRVSPDGIYVESGCVIYIR